MNFNIDSKIFQQFPDLKVGVILIKGMNNSRRISPVESLLRGMSAQRGKGFAERDINEEPMVKAWNQAYGRVGVNPNDYPPSISALLKRVKSGKEIPHINALVDLYNYFSLKHLLPIGGEDLDWLCGDLNLTYTKGTEPFRPIGSIEVQTAKEGEVAYMDMGGITCRHWNYRECERTKFTQKTVNAAILVEDLSKMHMDEFGRVLKEIQEGVLKYIGGQIETHILTIENPSLDLGIEGRKNVDDRKIPQQEKAYFLEKELKKKAAKSQRKQSIRQVPVSKPLKLDNELLLTSELKNILQKAVKKAFKLKKEIKIDYSGEESHGDYSSNIALKLSKEMNMPPNEIAKTIISNIKEEKPIEKVEIAGPGFINFFISKEVFQDEIKKILEEKDNYGASKTGEDKPLIVEYSAPNIAKPLGVHHLLSTIIGQTLYNIFKFIGFKCVSINHIGDWGTQFGKLIYAYKNWGNKETVEKNPINELLALYVKFHNEAEKNNELEDEARKEFKKFEEGDSENRELWKWFVAESMKEINKTYEEIGGIHFDYTQGESFYEDKMGDLLKSGKKEGIFEEGEEGAFVVKYKDPDISPFVVQKKDGATLYSTRDFAALKYRIDTWHPEKIIYVVDTAQTLHFKQLFLAAERFPWYGNEGEHVSFGRMRMKEGKMSTRKGNVILLNEVLEEAINRAGKILHEKNHEIKNKEEIAKVVGIGAVKYHVLLQNRTTDITFDWDTMLSLDGNSAPYLQYSYARAKSILRKSK
ncbi:MAG: arginine--tRNA ligase, partial [Candidatus Gracilibacteria bacterium]